AVPFLSVHILGRVLGCTALIAAGCGGDGGPFYTDMDASVDASGETGVTFPRRALSAVSDTRGIARVPTPVGEAELFLVDAVTQQPITGARVSALESPDDGLLVRVSRDEEGYEPEIRFIP